MLSKVHSRNKWFGDQRQSSFQVHCVTLPVRAFLAEPWNSQRPTDTSSFCNSGAGALCATAPSANAAHKTPVVAIPIFMAEPSRSCPP